MDIHQATRALERAWDDGGFLERIRRGRFEATDANEFLALIGSIDLGDADVVPKRFLSLVWFLPSFLSWQRDRVKEVGCDLAEYDRFVARVHNVFENVLGVP